MRALLQRVSEASVVVADQEVARVGSGLLVLLGVARSDSEADADRLARKTAGLRIFPDEHKPMNRSVQDVQGQVLVVPQFTLAADTSKGKRPSFATAAPAPQARQLYERYVAELESVLGQSVPTGVFGADMQIALVNDGPVSFMLE